MRKTNEETKKATTNHIKKQTEEVPVIDEATMNNYDESSEKEGKINPGKINDELVDNGQVQEIVTGLSKISKTIKESCVSIDKQQIRLLIDAYYQTQAYRITLSNQIRAVAQGYDEASASTPAIKWLLKDIQNREAQIEKMISAYAESEPVCKWAMKVVGIGPKFSAYLWSCIDLDKCHHASQFISYAGLNDNNNPWLGKEKAENLVNGVYEELGLSSKSPVTEDVLVRCAIKARRNIDSVRRGFVYHKNPQKGKVPSDKNALISYFAKPPYNADLKKKVYLIGESFCKQSNREASLYGRLYKEKKAIEIYKNEQCEFADQAAKLLSEKKYDKNKDTYKYLSQGKLSPAHINNRAKRWATTKFLVHFFEACYVYKYKKNPPQVYPIAYMGHVDYLEPEVPYTELFN